MIAYVVTHDPPEAELLRRILPDELCQGVGFVVGGSLDGVKSMARTLVAFRETPVAVVVGANTTDTELIRSLHQDIEEIIKIVSPGIPIKVIVAAPQLEVVFFQDPQLLCRLFDGPVTDEILCLARTDPRRALDELIAGSDSIHQPVDIWDALTPEDFETLRQADVIRELSDFLRQVRELAPSTAGAS